MSSRSDVEKTTYISARTQHNAPSAYCKVTSKYNAPTCMYHERTPNLIQNQQHTVSEINSENYAKH